MENKEIIETIKMAIAEIEWEYPMNYVVAFEEAIKILEKQNVKTNADIIRNMNDEGLAKLLHNIKIIDEDSVEYKKIENNIVFDDENDLLEWLKKDFTKE